MSCEHDPLNQKDWDVNFQKIVPGSKVHRFMHSAHEPQIEETEEFNRVLDRILAELSCPSIRPTPIAVGIVLPAKAGIQIKQR